MVLIDEEFPLKAPPQRARSGMVLDRSKSLQRLALARASSGIDEEAYSSSRNDTLVDVRLAGLLVSPEPIFAGLESFKFFDTSDVLRA
mmetsp:Transcript_18593/g.43552  ORF Transcript_18593/g.43552 Transcript_18593/m.43552 type:complete len:88 (+) Transcript_18593:2583-2846(+)